MSKKAINQAKEQVEASGFLAGMAQFRKEDSITRSADVLKYSEALSLLGIMGWSDAYQMLSDLYYKAESEGYENSRYVAECLANQATKGDKNV